MDDRFLMQHDSYCSVRRVISACGSESKEQSHRCQRVRLHRTQSAFSLEPHARIHQCHEARSSSCINQFTQNKDKWYTHCAAAAPGPSYTTLRAKPSTSLMYIILQFQVPQHVSSPLPPLQLCLESTGALRLAVPDPLRSSACNNMFRPHAARKPPWCKIPVGDK